MIRRFDPLGRSAFGVLCVAGMTLWSIPVLFFVGVIGGIAIAVSGNGDRALAVWLGSWIAAGFATALFLFLAYTFWPLASDWIVEWQGYITALAIGMAGLGLMALTVFVTTWPLAIELLIPLAITFGVGFSIPGWFLGLGSKAIRTLEHRRERL